MKKPRADSHLKTLPPERQRTIIDALQTRKLAEVRADLRQDGIETSSAALSEFWAWWHLREQFQDAESSVQTLCKLLKDQRPDMPEEQLADYGQQVFSLLALKQQEPKEWARIQKLRLLRQTLAIEQRKVTLLEQKAEQADQAEEIVSGPLSPEEKLRKMREVFGIA